MSNLLRRFQVWRNSTTGLTFVNRVLSAMGRPLLNDQEYGSLRDELRRDTELASTYESKIPRLREISPHKKIANWEERYQRADAQADIFYVLTRVLRPAVFVETGVASGSMTSFILAAINRNGFGMLYSFDIPTKAGERTMDWTVKDESEVGFLIPQAYRQRWKLTFGDSTYELPRAFEGKQIDCFFHDSDHTYEHMTFEYAFAAKHLAPGGLILSDDTSMNDSFFRYFGGRARIFFNSRNPNIGIVVPGHV
jgi:predicted O-methyltransferase YrrM